MVVTAGCRENSMLIISSGNIMKVLCAASALKYKPFSSVRLQYDGIQFGMCKALTDFG
jgi:hypothetical protein